MANFNTHLLAASAASTILATAAMNAQLIETADGPWLILIGTIGGLLPDIDSDHSKPVKLLFHALGLLGAAVIGFTLQNHFPVKHLMLISALAYGSIRFPLFSAFALLTEHRGIFHSILSAVFFALLITCLSFYLLHQDKLHSWLNGLFIALGYVIHLLLDEIYSVDLANGRIKRSFGSAIKLYSLQNISASLLMIGCTLALSYIAPSPAALINLCKQITWPVIPFLS